MVKKLVFEDVVNIYLKGRLKEKTEREFYSLQHLQSFFAGRKIFYLRRRHIRDYVHHRISSGVKESTVRRELWFFCAAINFVRHEYDYPQLPNPIERLGLREEEARIRWITREEASRLIAAAESNVRPHLACFVRLALNTGCRRGELLNLEWRRVDNERGIILFESNNCKSRRRQVVPLNQDAMKTLRKMREWQERQAVSSDYVFAWEKGKITTFKTSWRTALRRADIDDFRIHDLRHTFASWLVMQGVSLYVVKELLRHSSITVTEKYAHLAPSQTAYAVQMLLPF